MNRNIWSRYHGRQTMCDAAQISAYSGYTCRSQASKEIVVTRGSILYLRLFPYQEIRE